eukprot:2166619-Rhodomonas_salina.1
MCGLEIKGFGEAWGSKRLEAGAGGAHPTTHHGNKSERSRKDPSTLQIADTKQASYTRFPAFHRRTVS